MDTNLLVYAHRAACPEHLPARRAIEEAADSGEEWGIPGPCVFEFWSVVTHPSSVGGPSKPSAARSFIQGLMDTAGAVILPPPTALEVGVSELWTHDAGFIGLPGIRLRDPLQSA